MMCQRAKASQSEAEIKTVTTSLSRHSVFLRSFSLPLHRSVSRSRFHEIQSRRKLEISLRRNWHAIITGRGQSQTNFWGEKFFWKRKSVCGLPSCPPRKCEWLVIRLERYWFSKEPNPATTSSVCFSIVIKQIRFPCVYVRTQKTKSRRPSTDCDQPCCRQKIIMTCYFRKLRSEYDEQSCFREENSLTQECQLMFAAKKMFQVFFNGF